MHHYLLLNLFNLPQYRMQHQTVWLVEALNNSVFERAIQSSHVNLLLVAVITCPEQVPGHPVYSEAVSVGKVCGGIKESEGSSLHQLLSSHTTRTTGLTRLISLIYFFIVPSLRVYRCIKINIIHFKQETFNASL